MSNPINNYLLSKLQQRKDENNFRSLMVSRDLVDFYSNDYLGFARDAELKKRIEEEVRAHPELLLGSTGSRLLSGNNEYVESLEKYLSEFHHAESALIFNSGFDANYGLLSTLPYKGDTIIYDELVHASIHDGIRNSKADSVAFSHNDVSDLEEKLKSETKPSPATTCRPLQRGTMGKGLKYVVVESIYSMDGDFAPLKEIAAICEKYDAGLIVDEAHATGIVGTKGGGRVTSEIPSANVLARIHTFSKALGVHGAVILCQNNLKEFLINYCRPFIFSTALPYYSLASIKCAYQFLNESNGRREKLFALVEVLKNKIRPNKNFRFIPSDTPIQSILLSGNTRVKEFASTIQQKGFDVRPILSPTVPKGKERIRICLHSFNTEQEVIKLAEEINTYFTQSR